LFRSLEEAGLETTKILIYSYAIKQSFLLNKGKCMDKMSARIISKVGLLLVVVGFFMPITCNMNGFQLAENNSNHGGSVIFTLGLYGIFVFSCIGSILLLLLLVKKAISYKWDCVAIIGVAASTLIVFAKMGSNKDIFGRNKYQSGAYLIITGLIIAVVFAIMAFGKKRKKSK
jgi:hypothetical protein